MQIEEGKYYRTADGRKVGPVRIAETNTPLKWALMSAGKNIYEVVGIPFADAFRTKLVSEWTDEPKLWRDMTPEEKGALLLAHHEGKVIETSDGRSWFEAAKPRWSVWCSYRIKPAASSLLPLKVGKGYDTISKGIWRCIHVEDGKAWLVSGNDTPIPAYVWNAETGEALSLPPKYDVVALAF